VLVGLTVSYYGDIPPGGTVVLVASSSVLVAMALDAVR
jgi:ABC-type Mn2+/Zn2+ transport system permease subunit